MRLKGGEEMVAAFAARLKQEHLQVLATGGKALFGPITIPYKGTRER